jgi:hypothetical protein
MKTRANGETQIAVRHVAEKVEMCIESGCGDHVVTHTIFFTHPEFALRFAEELRAQATAAKIYEENNPN